jgi:uncharacterized membrane protein
MGRRISFVVPWLVLGIVVACGDEETTAQKSNPPGDAGADADASSDSSAEDASPDVASDASDASETNDASETSDASDANDGADAGPTLYDVHLVTQLAGKPFSAPLGMNESGQVVGYAGDEAWSPFSEPVRVDPPATLVQLSTPSPNYGFARDIVNDGSVIVGEYEFEGAVWSKGVLSKLAPVDGWFSTSGWGITEAGLVVGTYADHDDALPPNPVGPRPCYWPTVTAEPVPLATLDGEANGAAYAVNDQNAIAGVSASSQGYVATRWASPTSPAENLGHVTGAVLSEARGISSNGILAGRSGFANGTGKAFWLPVGGTQLVALPNLPNAISEYAEAFDVNASGLVVGTSTNSQAQTVHAVGWDVGVAFDFNDRLVAPHPNVQYLSSAVAVSDDGLVACEAVLVGSTGDTLRAIAVLVPKTGAN